MNARLPRHGKTSVIIPCRNEQGNLYTLIDNVAKNLVDGDEIIIVEGGSTDSTFYEATRIKEVHSSKVKLFKQSGTGKFDAVLKGISESKGETLMIWDADGTVNIEQNLAIYKFENAQKSLVMGDRLRGKRDPEAMRFFNLLGNWGFAFLWTLILKQKPIDLLCGTKRFPREVIDLAPKSLVYKDPFGDFTIIAMACKLNLPIISVPVHYHARSYGKTNIQRWRSGLSLLKLSFFAFKEISSFGKGRP